jgi:hypothetical protein
MTPPPSTPKKTRRVQPKIIGHTSPTPRVSGTNARSSLRIVSGPPAGTIAASNTRPAVRPPVGAPGMHGFPRARIGARDPQGGRAVSVTRALRDQAEAAAAEAASSAAPQPVLIDATKSKPRRTRATDPNRPADPARPSVRGRPTTPDEQPLSHAPAAERPTEPPLRTTLARPHIDATQAVPRPVRRRTEVWARDPSRPRPSRLLAELNAALADELAAAE